MPLNISANVLLQIGRALCSFKKCVPACFASQQRKTENYFFSPDTKCLLLKGSLFFLANILLSAEKELKLGRLMIYLKPADWLEGVPSVMSTNDLSFHKVSSSPALNRFDNQ